MKSLLKALGISTAVIYIGIFLALLPTGENPAKNTGLPPYPGSFIPPQTIENALEESGQSLPSGVAADLIYAIRADHESVLNWYRCQMSGWEKIADNGQEYEDYGWGYLTYVKGDEMAIIIASEVYDHGTKIILMRGPIAAFEADS